jgi:hypothetical protein
MQESILKKLFRRERLQRVKSSAQIMTTSRGETTAMRGRSDAPVVGISQQARDTAAHVVFDRRPERASLRERQLRILTRSTSQHCLRGGDGIVMKWGKRGLTNDTIQTLLLIKCTNMIVLYVCRAVLQAIGFFHCLRCNSVLAGF